MEEFNIPISFSYSLAKDFLKLIGKYTTQQLETKYENYKLLRSIGIDPVKNTPLSIYYYALFDFICLGYSKEWGFIFSDGEVFQKYVGEFIDYSEDDGAFQYAINAELNRNRQIRELKSLPKIPEEALEAFFSEMEKARTKIIGELSFTDRVIYNTITQNFPQTRKKTNVILEQAINEYVRNFGTDSLLTLSELSQFYIEVLGEEVKLEISAIEHRENLNLSKKNTGSDTERLIARDSGKVIDLPKKISRLFLRGNPGTGKSTSLKIIFLDNLNKIINGEAGGKIPILINAKYYHQFGDFKKLILKKTKVDESLFPSLMVRRDILIMFDGLNEIKPSLIGAARREIREFLEDFHLPSFIITSRIYNFDSYRIRDSTNLKIKIYDLRPLDEKDIKEYIFKQTKGNTEIGKEIWAQIKRTPKMRRLVSNPMYLKMMLIVAKESKDEKRRIPRSKGELYNKFISKLLSWEDEKLDLWGVEKNFIIDEKLRYLADLAYHMIQERSLPEEDVISILNQRINNYKLSTLFLKELKNNYLVQEEETGDLSFIHDTYSEYFGAVWLKKYFERHNELPIPMGEQQWFESIVMCSDLFKNTLTLEKYLQILLTGEKNSFPIVLPGVILKLKNSQVRICPLFDSPQFSKNNLNSELSVGCSVAFNIFYRTNKRKRKIYFEKAEDTLHNYLSVWMYHYFETGEEIISLENLFAAIGALSSKRIFTKVFCDFYWILVWGNPKLNPSMLKSFSGEEIDKLENMSLRSINAFLNNLSDFTEFYLFLTKEIPTSQLRNPIFKQNYSFLKSKLFSHVAKNNIELMKYQYRKSLDYDLLEKIGERDINFFFEEINKREDNSYIKISKFLEAHPFFEENDRLAINHLISPKEKYDYLREKWSFHSIESKENFIANNLLAARESLTLRNYDEAAKSFLKVLRESPNNASALRFLRKHFSHSGNFEAGIKVFKEAEKAGGGNAFLLQSLGFFFLKAEKIKEAILYFKGCEKKFGLSPRLLKGLGLCYLNLNDYQNVRVYVKLMENFAQKSPYLYGTMGHLIKNTGELKLAISYFKKYLSFYNRNSIIWGNLGNCYFQTGEFAKAIEAFVREFNLDTSNLLAICQIANCYMKLGNYKKAKEWYLRAEKTNPLEPKVISGLINVYVKLEEQDLREEYLKKLDRIAPNNPYNLSQFADYHQHQNQFQLAIQYLEKLLELQPKDETTLWNLAFCLRKLDKYGNAIPYLETLIEISPNNLAAISSIAFCYKEVGNYKKAIEIYESYLESDDQNIFVLKNIAECCGKALLWDKAFHYNQIIVRRDPEYLPSILFIAVHHKKLKNFDLASLFFEKYLAIEPSNISVIKDLVDCYAIQQEYSKATEWLEKQIKFDPKDTFQLGKLGKFYRQMGDLTNAIKCYKKQLEKNPHKSIVLYHLQSAYSKLGFHKKAKEIELKRKKAQVLDIRRQSSRLMTLVKNTKFQSTNEIKNIKFLLKNINRDPQLKKLLQKKGLDIAIFKKVIESLMKGFLSIQYGFVKFVDFSRMVCADGAVGVFQSEHGTTLLGIKKMGLKGMKLLSDLPERQIHSLESYREILAYNRPIIKIPSPTLLKESVDALCFSDDLPSNFEALASFISDYLVKKFSERNIKDIMTTMIHLNCFYEEEPSQLPLFQRTLKLKNEFHKNPNNLILSLEQEAAKKLTSIIGKKPEKSVLRMIFDLPTQNPPYQSIGK